MASIHKFPLNTALYLEMQKQISAALNPYFSSWTFKCQICDRLCPEKHSLATHIARTHPGEYKSIDHTQASPELNLIPAAAQEGSIANDPKILECPQLGCVEIFSNFFSLNTHILKEHAQFKPFLCEIPNCRHKTRNPSLYRAHMVKVHKTAPTTPAYLEMQKQISAALNPYFSDWKFKCQICNRLFPQQTSLTLHVTQIHGKES
jgi:uncharacterized C2H2 Zn-finger protein